MGNLGEREVLSEEATVAEQAARWLHVMKTAGPTERADFWRWLTASPLHVREMLVMGRWDEIAGHIDPERRIDVAQLLDQPASSLVHLSSRRRDAAGARPAPPRRILWAGLAAAVSIAVAAWFGSAQTWRSDTYATRVGEQRTFDLEDGSMIALNTQSQVKVRYSDDARDIYLSGGQALFEVKHDARRPFRVHAAEAVIQALGTQFDVRVLPGRTLVAVVEGAVQVSMNAEGAKRSAAVSRQPARLSAGESIVIDGGKLAAPAHVDPNAITAWRQQRLVFNDESLSWIIAEFNRYNVTPQLRVETEALGARRFNGVFNARNPESLLKYLTENEGLAFTQQQNEIVIREEPPKK